LQEEEEDDIWEMYFDNDTGRNYWYNTETQETTWENPMQRESSARDGDPTNHDSFASMVTPELPSEVSQVKPNRSETSHAGETEVDETVEVHNVGGKWRKVLDENSGNHYFYHIDTHETTWTMPPEFDNKLLMNHQDELAKARAGSLKLNRNDSSHDDFSLPMLLTPHQSSGFARYSAAEEESSEEEDSDFSDEPEGPSSTNVTGVGPVVRQGSGRKGPPPQPARVQPGYGTPGKSLQGATLSFTSLEIVMKRIMEMLLKLMLAYKNLRSMQTSQGTTIETGQWKNTRETFSGRNRKESSVLDLMLRISFIVR